MMVSAPLSRAPWTALSPTAPAPITSTDEPGVTRATRVAAPTPVITPQPIRQARSNGISRGTTTALLSCTTQHSACEDTAEKCRTSRPLSERREAPSSRWPCGWVRVKTSQRMGSPRSQ